MKTIKQIQGFSLVEFMVAMVIALLAMLAATELYVGTRQSYRLQTMQSRLSEDGRFVMSMLQRIVMQAGFRPNPANSIGTYITPTSATEFSITFTGDNSNTIGCDGSIVDAAQTLVLKKEGRKLKCGNIEWITPSATGIGNNTEVMDFKVDYGVDKIAATNNSLFGCGTKATNYPQDCVADSYAFSDAAANPDKIVAVKICLILRTEKTDASANKKSAYKDCSGADISNSATDMKLYRTFYSTILLRNR